jgi:hypothetical protein
MKSLDASSLSDPKHVSNIVFKLFLVENKDVQEKYISLALPYTESLIQSWHDYCHLKDEKKFSQVIQSVKSLFKILKIQSKQSLFS